MGQPVTLSDALILDARLVGERTHRSIAEQIEFWVQLGRAVEPRLGGSRAMALRRAGSIRPLAEQIATVNTPEGRQRVADYVRAQPFPHYEPEANRPGYLVRIEADGTRTAGHFVRRRFEPAEE